MRSRIVYVVVGLVEICKDIVSAHRYVTIIKAPRSGEERANKDLEDFLFTKRKQA